MNIQKENKASFNSPLSCWGKSQCANHLWGNHQVELAIILFLIIYPEIYYGLKTLPKTRRGILTEVVTTRGRNNTLHASTVCEYSHESCKLPRFWTQHSAGLVKISKTCWLGNAHLKCDHVNNQAKDLWKKILPDKLLTAVLNYTNCPLIALPI